jgi:hypothetical protein
VGERGKKQGESLEGTKNVYDNKKYQNLEKFWLRSQRATNKRHSSKVTACVSNLNLRSLSQ